MDNFDKIIKEETEVVKKTGSSRYSKAAEVSMIRTLLNTPEHEVSYYMKDKDNPVKRQPCKEWRDELALEISKKCSMDADDAQKVANEINISKKGAEALIETIKYGEKEVAKTGRKIVIYPTAPDEAKTEIRGVWKDKKNIDTKKLEQQPDGSYKSVPTGNRKTQEQHFELRTTAKLPGWLEHTDPI